MTEPHPFPVARAVPPRHRPHHVLAGRGSRITFCGLIPPWDDQLHCRGPWLGETSCPDCGGPLCPTCTQAAEISR